MRAQGQKDGEMAIVHILIAIVHLLFSDTFPIVFLMILKGEMVKYADCFAYLMRIDWYWFLIRNVSSFNTKNIISFFL